MANRYIRDSILTSDSINQLTPFQETLFYRLIVTVDDFGRFDGRIAVLRSHMFPLKEFDTKAENEAFRNDISSAMDKLAELGMIIRYEVMGRPYIRIANWDNYQRVRTAVSKYPDEHGEYKNPNGNFNNNTIISDSCETNHKAAKSRSVMRSEVQNTRRDDEQEKAGSESCSVIENVVQYTRREAEQDKNHAACSGDSESQENVTQNHATDYDNDYDTDNDYDYDTLEARPLPLGRKDEERDLTGATPEAIQFDFTWKNRTGRRPSRTDYAMFGKLQKQYAYSKVMQAIDESFMSGHPGNWKYIIGILKDGPNAWKKKKAEVKVEERNGKCYYDGYEVLDA